jgi:GTP diphosphokinase / guanosine-3',5'-bis(diphosphate) 3'-diphosphatase
LQAAVSSDDAKPDISALIEAAAAYLAPERLKLVEESYDFAAECHLGQMRKSGDHYITHPIEVTDLVVGLELDQYSIAAALLHDVQEDCGIPNAVIEEKFGPEVASLVEGLTKLERLPLRIDDDPNAARMGLQAQNLRKMLLAMAEDIRVVLIKLCDRLHNMRTLGALAPEQQRRIARETMDIYAPLANRLGVWNIKWELEDLSFRYLEPDIYKSIAERLTSTRKVREGYIEEASEMLRTELEAAGIDAMVDGRAKHIYSIYDKMQRYAADQKTFDQIQDLLALRVHVNTEADCYHALGIVHSLWRPLPGQFDDYIANPKDSMYQSLHSTVIALRQRSLEVQIRTHEMHRVAEYGVAAHWRYKDGASGNQDDEERISWLRQLLEWQRDLVGAEEFVESVKTDVFKDQVFVLTPKGDVIDLPAEATPLDFAFRIHTDLGYQTIGAMVNGKMTSLNTPLANGDVVEVRRSRTSGPSRDWLNEHLGYVRTTHARTKIRQWFRRQQRAESIERGREMLQREVRRLALDLPEFQETILSFYNYQGWDDLLAAVGYGDVSTDSVTKKLSHHLQEQEDQSEGLPETYVRSVPISGGPGLRVLGVGNLLTTMGQCCNPVPGDGITGYVTRSRGITVHRSDCSNVVHEKEPERLVDVEWGETSRTYPTLVRVHGWDRIGLLRDISIVVGEEHVNMVGVRTTENDDSTVMIYATLETSGIEQMSLLLARIEAIKGVLRAERDLGAPAKGS